jgi:hypothetical protein
MGKQEEWIPAGEPPVAHLYDGSERSDIIWIRYESVSADEKSKRLAEYDFILGRCLWILKGTSTFPDAVRGVENPVCKMEWSRGEAYFVNLQGRSLKATHWCPCVVPLY